MKKYPYLRFKLIVPTVLLLLLIIFICSYFIGGLKAAARTIDKLEWNTEGFIDIATVDPETLNNEKLVAHNTQYAMIFDENTTIVSVYKKASNWSESNPTNGDLLYSSAIKGGSGELAANLTITYYDANGKTSDFNSYDKSVNYANVTTGTYEKYYSIRYNEDSNSVDVYYRIGNFAPYIFPTKYKYSEFEELFVGNCILKTPKDADYKTNTDYLKRFVDVVDADGNKITLTKNDRDSTVVEQGLQMYFDYLVITTNECAKYVLEKGIGEVAHSSAPNNKFSELNSEATDYIDSKTSGYWLASNLYDENGKFKLQLGVNCNCSDSPLEVNPYLTFDMLNTLTKTCYSIQGITGTVKDELPLDLGFPTDMHVEKYQTETSDVFLKLPSLNILLKQTMFNYMYVGNYTTNEQGIKIYESHPYYREVVSKDPSIQALGLSDYPMYFDYNNDGIYTENEAYQYGGYPLRDEDGNYLYDENNKPIQAGFTNEMAQEQNSNYGYNEDAQKISFNIGIRFQLTSDGLETTLIHDSIVEPDGGGAVLAQIKMCKYMTIAGYSKGNEKAGQIILPDGSGSVISFNSEKGEQYANKYPEKRIYGNDAAINQLTRGSSFEKIMLAMYGFIETGAKKGVVAIVDDGGSQVSINADIQRSYDKNTGMNYYNYAYFNAYVREAETVTVTSSSTYVKTTKDLYQGDIRYSYVFLSGDDLDYVDVANVYRDYLVSKYNLTEKTDTTTTPVPTITFIGAYEKKALKAGIVTDVEYSLTTYEQAHKIVNQLVNNGLSTMNIVYRSWTDDEINQKTTTDVDVSDVLGSKKELKELSKYFNSLGLDFFPEYKVAVGRGYDLSFGSLKYSSKSISGSYSNALQYVLSTGLENKDSHRGSYVSPIYYNSLLTKYMKNFVKLGTSGIYLSDLGNMNVADYSRNIQLYSAGGVNLQRTALETVERNVDKVMLSAPFDYALNYCDIATMIPVQTTLYGIIDYSIPLYQLVVSGLFDYSSKPVNYNNDYSITWNMLKAIETGSNLAYVLSAEDTNVLLETQYTEYYNSYYVNWKDKIHYMNNTLKAAGIYDSRLVDHEYLSDNVVKVTYENGLVIAINYDNDNYINVENGLTIANNWFAILEKGGN